LSKLYSVLSKSSNIKVKISIASSLHEIAKIIGENYSQKDLMPIVE